MGEGAGGMAAGAVAGEEAEQKRRRLKGMGIRTYSWFRRPQEFSGVDTDGWTPLIHAVNASSYSRRAAEAAIFLLINSPFMESSGRRGQPSVAHKVVNMATTGARPPGKTALLFACSGSDALFRSQSTVFALLTARADIEARDQNGNTPFLLAAACGITDVVKLLIENRADLHVTNDAGKGALQLARHCSSDVRGLLEHHGCVNTHANAPAGNQRAGIKHAKVCRYAASRNDPTSWWYDSNRPPRAHRG